LIVSLLRRLWKATMKNTSIQCACVNAKVGTIAVKSGIKPVFVFELADDQGELLIKFFNSDKTSKGNYTVGRNSDFARLYRLTIGDNPSARFSRADRLLGHFVGHGFLVEYTEAIDKLNNFYRKVTAIKPLNPVVSEGWTVTGHLIKNVSQKSRKLASKCQRDGDFLTKTYQEVGNCDQPQAQMVQGLEQDFNPIQHPTYHIRTSNIPIDISLFNSKGILIRPPPDIDLATLEIDQKFLF
jgi:hypothetical protein